MWEVFANQSENLDFCSTPFTDSSQDHNSMNLALTTCYLDAACVFFQDIYWKSLVSLFFSAVYVSSFDEKKSLKSQFFALFHAVSVLLFSIPVLTLTTVPNESYHF